MELSIQERLKDLRVERGLTLEQLEEQVNLSKSALGSYEAKDFKDISHYAIIKLAKFYGVTADYLLGLSQTRNHPNAELADQMCIRDRLAGASITIRPRPCQGVSRTENMVSTFADIIFTSKIFDCLIRCV